MLAVKRGVSTFSRAASSSRVTLTSSSALRCRSYADDGSKDPSRKDVYGKLLSAEEIKDRNVLEDVLSSERRRAPDQPPRYKDVKLPPSNRVRPAPPVGGPQFQLPQRSQRPPTNEDESDVNSLIGSGSGERDEADRKADAIFGSGDEKAKERKKVAPIIQTNLGYRLYVTAKMKNCIMTLVNERNCPVATVSSGRCKFRNSAEGTYEAGYQCAIRMLESIREEQKNRKEGIDLEILIKGFGQGRSALLKALTMSEGEAVRPLVTRLTDTTPIKIGGVRLQKARRL